MQIEIKIEDITREQIIEAAAAEAIDHAGGRHHRGEWINGVRDAVTKQIETAVDSAVRELIDDAVRERIAVAVDIVLTEGWPITDEYGRDTGKRRNLSSIVLDALGATSADRYSGRPDPVPVAVTRDVLNRRLGKEFEAEVTKARDAFRAQVDDMIRAKLADALRSSLGLR